MKPLAVFLGDDPAALERAYSPEIRAAWEGRVRLAPGILGSEALRSRPCVAPAEVALATWGLPRLDAAALAALPRLRALFYAAGSVRAFAGPLLERGVAVYSAAQENARPTAEYALAQILLALKGALPAGRALLRSGDKAAAWMPPAHVVAARDAPVALLGAGRVARALARLLAGMDVRVLVHEPLLGPEAARAMGAEPVGLAEAFARGRVVSNHLADLPGTRGLVTRDLLLSMPPGATFLNTGRGATVDEAGLWEALRLRPDLFAVLDVLSEEPPSQASPVWNVANAFVTPHLAGSLGWECCRLGRAMLEAFDDWFAGRPNPHRVEASELATRA